MQVLFVSLLTVGLFVVLFLYLALIVWLAKKVDSKHSALEVSLINSIVFRDYVTPAKREAQVSSFHLDDPLPDI